MRVPVLLVDDDEFARGFARTVMARAGFEVHEAEGVAAALALARNVKPEAVVTDWNLLDGNGGDLARSLHGTAAGLPVILISGEAGAGDSPFRDAAREFALILSKPFPPSALEEAIRAVTGQRQPANGN